MKKFVFLVCMLVPSLALAAGATVTVVNDVLEIVTYAVLTIVIGLVGWAAKWIAEKYKVTVPEAWLNAVNGLIDKAIHYAEEWAKNKLAANETVTGNAKLETATAFLLNIIGDDKRLVAMTEDQIKQLVEARLGERRTFGAMSMTSSLVSTAEGQAFPVDAKLISINDSGVVGLHLTNGDTVDITDILKRAGFTRPSTAPTEVARNGQSGFAKLGALILVASFGLLTMIAGCAWLKSDGKQLAKNAVNCEVGELFTLGSELAPSLEMNIKATIDPLTGKPNWSQFNSTVGSRLKSDAAGCALKIAIDELLKLASGVGAGFAPLAIDRAALLGGYETLRHMQFGDKTFDTTPGEK